MTSAGTIESPSTSASSRRPFIASYDLGYEFSQEYYIALQCLVEDADQVSFALVPQTEMEEVAS